MPTYLTTLTPSERQALLDIKLELQAAINYDDPIVHAALIDPHHDMHEEVSWAYGYLEAITDASLNNPMHSTFELLEIAAHYQARADGYIEGKKTVQETLRLIGAINRGRGHHSAGFDCMALIKNGGRGTAS